MKIVTWGEDRKIEYFMLVKSDERWTAMSKATGAFQAALAIKAIKGDIRGPGIIYPEMLGLSRRLAMDILSMLEKRGIQVQVNSTRNNS